MDYKVEKTQRQATDNNENIMRMYTCVETAEEV